MFIDKYDRNHPDFFICYLAFSLFIANFTVAFALPMFLNAPQGKENAMRWTMLGNKVITGHSTSEFF